RLVRRIHRVDEAIHRPPRARIVLGVHARGRVSGRRGGRRSGIGTTRRSRGARQQRKREQTEADDLHRVFTVSGSRWFPALHLSRWTPRSASTRTSPTAAPARAWRP